MFKTPRDFRKSLEAHLKNMAVKDDRDLQGIRRKVAFERLLARIFHRGSDSFVLKGGYAMELRFSKARATRDIDLTCLHRIEEANTTIEEVIVRELRQLARMDLGDYFTFEIGSARMDLDNAPYGGARYSVSSFVDERLFVRFQLDVGADVIVDRTEVIEGSDWLKYCGIDTPKMHMISIEQQLAEKLHAYTLPREQRLNTRAKDLIDMLLLSRLQRVKPDQLKTVIKRVFNVRGTHALPDSFKQPPSEWVPLYKTLAIECGLTQTMSQACEELNDFFQDFLTNHKIGESNV